LKSRYVLSAHQIATHIENVNIFFTVIAPWSAEDRSGVLIGLKHVVYSKNAGPDFLMTSCR
jgi:hypothetical protein